MCGIAGAISLRGEPIDAALLLRMAELQRHRGPDHAGEFCDGPVALASQRLAIIDPAGGNQPIFNEDGSIVTVYNGAIYNYPELRRELVDRGHTFKTTSDTEVLVHAYEEWGPEFVRKLNGMFAFALFDRRKKRLMLARDPLGIKPLYYVRDAESLWFASEVKSLLGLPHVSARPDPYALADYLLYQNIFAERSLFQSIVKLRPGHYLLVEGDRVHATQYWEVPLGARRDGSLADHLHEYRSRLNAAVARHLLSDVDVGAYLSGGYDSSAVSLVAARELGQRLPAFSGAFTEGEFYDERPTARAVARSCRTTLHEVEIDPATFWDALEPVCYAMDEPSIGCGAIPQYLVARQAARHVKVVLTGLGGDELFLGYEAYKAVAMRGRNPLTRLQLLCSLRPSELARVGYFLFASNPVVRHGLVGLFTPPAISTLLAPSVRQELRDYDPTRALERVLEPVRSAAPIDQTIYLYLKTYLPTLLVQEDKVGMAHALEARMPLCDRELVEFMLSVPLEHKLHRGRLKYFPRTALGDLYPPQVLTQPKRGFPVPLVRWFKGPLRSAVEARLFGPGSAAGEIFDPSALQRVWRRFLRFPGEGLASYYLANQLYSVLTVVVWYELFVRQGWERARDVLNCNPRRGSHMLSPVSRSEFCP